MEENENSVQKGYDLSQEHNYTDPIVRHDPTISKTMIPKADLSTLSSTDTSNPTDIDIKKIEAIDIPVVLLNNKVLDYTDIEFLYIDYDSFVPKIRIAVSQSDENLGNTDSPGLDNIITVVMTSRVDGAYKPISIDFYILSVETVNNACVYEGSYKLLSIEQNKTECIKFCPGAGCQGEWCNLPENNTPTTYEFLHELCAKSGLGFATTDKVKEISDNRQRFITNQNYKTAMEQHLKFAGIDENSIFDGWIDLYKYLVVINVPWVLSQDINIEDIGSYIEWNAPNATNRITDQQDLNKSYRFLTNNRETAQNLNILITSYKWITNNRSIRNKGTNYQYFTGQPLGFGENNTGSCTQHDVEVVENSDTGEDTKENYAFNRMEFLGNEMGNAALGNTPVLMQRQIRDNYFRKIRQRRLKVSLDITNLALQRGTLVYLYIFEYSQTAKREMLMDEMDNPIIRSRVDEGHIPNPFMCGFYYIDGMEFIYDKQSAKITQYLYLIKKEPYISQVKTEFDYVKEKLDSDNDIGDNED